MDIEVLKYPIGKYIPQPFSQVLLEEWLLDLQALPNMVEHTILNLDEDQLKTPYRPDGWTVHELVHHIADSHANAYIRFKLCLTEDNPVIKPYDEAAWVKLEDTVQLPVNVSLTLLHALHRRWHAALKDLPQEMWNRTVYHPEQEKTMSLWYLLGMYVWHGKHHVAHITSLRDSMHW